MKSTCHRILNNFSQDEKKIKIRLQLEQNFQNDRATGKKLNFFTKRHIVCEKKYCSN